MPILTATDPSRKRCAPVWVLILSGVVLPLVAVLGWSCHEPIQVWNQARRVYIGRPISEFAGPSLNTSPEQGWAAFKLPGGRTTGWWGVGWQVVSDGRTGLTSR